MTEYAIQLRTTPDARVPDVVALRRVLKVLLRSYGLRATDVREVAAPPVVEGAEGRGPAEARREVADGKKKEGGNGLRPLLNTGGTGEFRHGGIAAPKSGKIASAGPAKSPGETEFCHPLKKGAT